MVASFGRRQTRAAVSAAAAAAAAAARRSPALPQPQPAERRAGKWRSRPKKSLRKRKAAGKAGAAAKAAQRAQREAAARAVGPSAPTVTQDGDGRPLLTRRELRALQASGDNATKGRFVRAHVLLDEVLPAMGRAAVERDPDSPRHTVRVTPTHVFNLLDLLSAQQEVIVVPGQTWFAVFLPVTYEGATKRYLLALHAPAPLALTPEQRALLRTARKGLVKLFADKLKHQQRSKRKLPHGAPPFAMAGMRPAPRNPHEFCVHGRGPTEQTVNQLYDTTADAVWDYICDLLGHDLKQAWLQVHKRVWVDVCAEVAHGILPPPRSEGGAPMPPSRVFAFPGFLSVPFSAMSSVLECRTHLHCDRKDAPNGCFFCWNDNINGDDGDITGGWFWITEKLRFMTSNGGVLYLDTRLVPHSTDVNSIAATAREAGPDEGRYGCAVFNSMDVLRAHAQREAEATARDVAAKAAAAQERRRA